MFLREPDTPEAAAFLESERAANGYVMNLERAWAWRPEVAQAFVSLRKQLTDASTLTPREIAILVCATARARGDSYCALAWGARLAKLADAGLAAQVLRGDSPASPDPLTPAPSPAARGKTPDARETALLRWAGQMTRDPNATTPADVDALRAAGLSEREIFEATLYIALRLAFSTVNDALGAQPDAELVADAPAQVRAAVTYGRRPA